MPGPRRDTARDAAPSLAGDRSSSSPSPSSTLPALAGAAEPPNQNDRCSARRPQHLRHDRHRPVRHLPLRTALVRRLPGRRAGRGADLLHRPALLVPQRGVPVPPLAAAGPAQPRRRGRVDGAPAADGLRDVGVRAQLEPAPAGRRHALRARAHGRRRPRRGRPGRARPGRRGARTTGSRATRPATTAPTGWRSTCPRGSRWRSGRRCGVRVLSATGRAVPNLRLALTAAGVQGLPDELRPTPRARRASRSRPRPPTGRPADGEGDASPRPCRSSSPPAPSRRPQRPAPRRAGAAGAAGDRRRAGRARPRCASTSTAPSRTACWSARRARTRSSSRTRCRRGRRPSPCASTAPSARRPTIRCDGTPAVEGSFTTSGPGTYGTAPVRLERPGWYVYQEVVPSDDGHVGLYDALRRPGRAVRGRDAARRAHDRELARPRHRARRSSTPSRSAGLAGETVTVNAALYGPFPRRRGDRLHRPAALDGSFSADRRRRVPHGAGELTVPRLLHLRRVDRGDGARAAGADRVRRGRRDDGRDRARRRSRRRSARRRRSPARPITDSVLVGGLGVLTATVQRRAVGPLRDARGDDLHRHAVRDRHLHRQRRRHLHDRARACWTRPATTRTASRSSPRRPTRP